MEVAGLVGYDDRTLLKDGLGSALAKSKFEIEVFNEAFEQYFGAPSSDKNKNENSSDTAPDSPSSQELGEQLSQPCRRNLNLRKTCRAKLVDALQSGDEAAIAIRGRDRGTTSRRVSHQVTHATGALIRKMLDAWASMLSETRQWSSKSTEPAAFEAVQALREQLRNKVRDRVDRAYMVHAVAMLRTCSTKR
jgi:uncharacterized protein with von Willebrand factor type A (vWA) domain